MSRITRRSFLQASAAAGISTLVPFSRVRGANDDLRLAVIGQSGGQSCRVVPRGSGGADRGAV
jgi:hypothetical protein